MAKVLISVSELADALGRVPKIDVGGEPHIDAEALGLVMAALGATRPSDGAPWAAYSSERGFARFPPTVTEDPRALEDADRFYETVVVVEGDPRFADSPADAAERARLMALPPGPCVCAARFAASPDHPGHNPATHIHPGVNCEMCSMLSQGCEAHEYVDTTIRDPRQLRLETGTHEAPPALNMDSLPLRPPDIFDRPAANDNAFRPPSGSPDVRGADYSDL